MVDIDDDARTMGGSCSSPVVDPDYEPIALSCVGPPSSFHTLGDGSDDANDLSAQCKCKGKAGEDNSAHDHSAHPPSHRICSADSTYDSQPVSAPHSREDVAFTGSRRHYENYVSPSSSSPPPSEDQWHYERMPSFDTFQSGANEQPAIESCGGDTSNVNTGDTGIQTRAQHESYRDYNPQYQERSHSQYPSQHYLPHRPQNSSDIANDRSYWKSAPLAPLPFQVTRAFLEQMQFYSRQSTPSQNLIKGGEGKGRPRTGGETNISPVLLQPPSSTNPLQEAELVATPDYSLKSLPGRHQSNLSWIFEDEDNESPIRRDRKRDMSDVDSATEGRTPTRVKRTDAFRDDIVSRIPSEAVNLDASSNVREVAAPSLRNFLNALRKSDETQAALERWDKKMGLRRSHSKTMWDSEKSRHDLHCAFLKQFREQ